MKKGELRSVDSSKYYVGIDIGGTFTDVVFLNSETNELRLVKVPTTPGAPADGFFDGLDTGLELSNTSTAEIRTLFHGSTVATNAVLEGNGSRVGLLTTQGFKHILEIGRAYIPGIFTNYMRWEKPETLVPLELVREIPERLAVDGSVIREMNDDEVRELISQLLDYDVESLAISLIHSYTNPSHEERVEQLVHEIRPDLFVSRSSEVLPEYREYERTMTTVLNAYVMPVVARYLRKIEEQLDNRGCSSTIQVMRSDAGVMSLDAALERPVNTVLSGPSGGVKGASYLATKFGYPNIISMDMGGTSTDVCLSIASEPWLSTDTWISHYPIKVPIIDITTIGAGGGSIAHVSSAGALRVGPQSAGADPGPISYGRGGDKPTVTDANLVLGRLPAELASGEITLDIKRARAEIERQIAKPLGLSVEEAAYGILRIVNENMLGALRVVSVQRGIDPRDLVLVPFGGAGPVHGAELARLLGVNTMLVPSTPGVLSALGFLLSDVRNVFTLTKVTTIDDLEFAAYNREIEQLTQQANEWLEEEGVEPHHREVEVGFDVRYHGQAYELPIRVSSRLDGGAVQDLVQRFHAEHKRRYGFNQEFATVEVVTLRVTAIGSLPKLVFEPSEIEGEDATAALVSEKPVYFSGGYQSAGVFDRTLLRPGNRLSGPAVITQSDCTTVVAPGQTLSVDRYSNLVIETGA